jgi:subtilisin family serine protease
MAVVLACGALPATAQPARPTTRVPDDPRFAQQWQLSHDGVMGAERAWGLGRGGPITVAIVDSGVDMTHPDLVANLWTNPGEVPGNGVDDDGDGHVDDTHGWDVIGNDADPSDDNGHGTSIAGVVAARGDNGIGVAGVAWRARIMPVKVVDASASAPSAAIADGIRYAGAHGADIVLLALAGSDPGAYLQDAVRTASDAECSSSARSATAATTSTPRPSTRPPSTSRTSSASPRRDATGKSAGCRTSVRGRSTSQPPGTGSSRLR